MTTEKPNNETIRQFGVKYPDGRSFWILNENAHSSSLLGAYTVTSLASATDRGKFLDSWRASVASCGLNPDSVDKPQFIARDIVKRYSDPVDVND